ncbi:L-threonylcarbamoyladenylate synthase [Patescibacteria group bacterium]
MSLNKAVKVLKNKGIIIFPTDTVWGIGASLKCPEAINRLYQIKKRKQTKPTAVLVGSFSMAEDLGDINNIAKKLIAKFWPGGLTIVVKAKKVVPKFIQGDKQTIGLRMPNHKLLLKIINKLDGGIVAASANFSGYPAVSRKEMLDSRLKSVVDYVLDGEDGNSLPSTVIDTTKSPPTILRKGVFSSQKLLL